MNTFHTLTQIRNPTNQREHIFKLNKLETKTVWAPFLISNYTEDSLII